MEFLLNILLNNVLNLIFHACNIVIYFEIPSQIKFILLKIYFLWENVLTNGIFFVFKIFLQNQKFSKFSPRNLGASLLFFRGSAEFQENKQNMNEIFKMARKFFSKICRNLCVKKKLHLSLG